MRLNLLTSIKAFWRKLFPVRLVYIPFAKGFGKAALPDSKDPRFLREMAKSMEMAPVVYENAMNMLRRREESLRIPAPETTEAEREAWKWQHERLTIEAQILRTILLAPQTAANALNKLKESEKLNEEVANFPEGEENGIV